MCLQLLRMCICIPIIAKIKIISYTIPTTQPITRMTQLFPRPFPSVSRQPVSNQPASVWPDIVEYCRRFVAADSIIVDKEVMVAHGLTGGIGRDLLWSRRSCW